MGKINEEEEHYAKAYGTGVLNPEQFRNVMKDAEKRKLGLQRQLNDLTAKSSQETRCFNRRLLELRRGIP